VGKAFPKSNLPSRSVSQIGSAPSTYDPVSFKVRGGLERNLQKAMDSIRIYTGFDQREAVGWHVCVQSIIERTDSQVEIIPLTERLGKKLGIGTDGTNVFTKLRFAVPYLSGYRGWALFIDCADMLLMADVAELWALKDPSFDVMVVKHEYSTKHPVKYLGQQNLDYPLKNWSSVMLMNCGNFPWRKVTPEYIAKSTGQHLHRLEFLKPDRIGDLPVEWNHLVSRSTSLTIERS
jgi:hypothetical protein